MILQLLIAAVLGLITWKIASFLGPYIRKRSILRKQNIKGPEDSFLLGNTKILETDHVKFHKQILAFAKQYEEEKIFLIWMGPDPYIFCHHPESIEKILSSTQLMKKSDIYQFLVPRVGDGLLMSLGEKYRSRRKMLTPAFHFGILVDFIPVFNKNIRVLFENIERKSKENTKGEVEIFSLFNMVALDAIAESAMGVPIHAQKSSESKFVKAIMEINEGVLARLKNPLYSFDAIFYRTEVGKQFMRNIATVDEQTYRIIKERKQYRQQLNEKQANAGTAKELDEDEIFMKKHRLAFLDLMLEYQEQGKTDKEGRKVTDKDIRDEVNNITVGGFETIAMAITMATVLLANYPDEQRKVQEELDEIFQGDNERDVTSEDIPKMNYIELVIKETVRMYPSVAMIGRKAENDTELCGYTIPAGTNFMLLLMGLHMRDDIYHQPHVFRPRRFREMSSDRNAYSYVPFSGGPRNCIGQKYANMELKVLIASIFRKYNVSTEMTEEDLKMTSHLVLSPSLPVMVKFTPR